MAHMSDTVDLHAYVAAIEAALTRARGRECALSPHDFALARAWHAAGVALALVVDLVEREGAQARSLAYLRRRIDAAAKRAAVRAAPHADGAVLGAPNDDGVDAVRAWLGRLLRWIDERPRAEFDGARALASAFVERPALEPAALRELDDALTAAALRACGDTQLALFRQEAARAAARQRGQLDDEALEEALRRYERRRARELLGVPERD